MIPECYGGDIYEASNLNTLEDCISGCKSREDCKFISYGGTRCIFKNGIKAGYYCNGCDSNGYCSNEGNCDNNREFCSVNMYRNPGTALVMILGIMFYVFNKQLEQS